MSIELLILSNHLILCHTLLLLPSIFPSIRVFSNESTLHIRWPKNCSFSFTGGFLVMVWTFGNLGLEFKQSSCSWIWALSSMLMVKVLFRWIDHESLLAMDWPCLYVQFWGSNCQCSSFGLKRVLTWVENCGFCLLFFTVSVSLMSFTLDLQLPSYFISEKQVCFSFLLVLPTCPLS